MKQFTIITSSLLLITAIFELDIGYWYYQLLRWIVFVFACLSAYNSLENKKLLIMFAIIAIIFNPIAPIYFPKEIWRTIDGASGLIFLLLLKNKFKQFFK